MAVMSEVEYLQRQHSPELGYAVLTEQVTIAALRPSMIRNGIVMRPVSCHYDKIGEYVTAKGARMAHMVGRRRFAFDHVDSGESTEVEVFAEAADSADRASSKMNTITKKTALREFFAVETGNDETAVVAQRGEPNERLFRRAVSAIKASKDAAATAAMLEKVLNSKSAGWTEEQVTSLHDVRSQHDDWLAAKATKEANKEKF